MLTDNSCLDSNRPEKKKEINDEKNNFHNNDYCRHLLTAVRDNRLL